MRRTNGNLYKAMGLLGQAPGAANAQKPTAARRAPWAEPRAKTGDQRPQENVVPHRLFLSGRDRAFERYLGFKASKIPADCCNRQFLLAAAIANRAVARLETSVDFRLVPAFGMPHVGNRQIVLFGPEEGDGLKPFACPEDIARGRLALPLGDDKMFDSNRFTGEPVRPSGDIAGRENTGGARLKIFVHRDAAV